MTTVNKVYMLSFLQRFDLKRATVYFNTEAERLDFCSAHAGAHMEIVDLRYWETFGDTGAPNGNDYAVPAYPYGLNRWRCKHCNKVFYIMTTEQPVACPYCGVGADYLE